MDQNDKFNREEPISIEGESKYGDLLGGEESLVSEGGESKISALRPMASASAKLNVRKTYKRVPKVGGDGAIRCRIFYSKIAVNALEHLEGQINDWLDAENIEVKQVSQIIGNMVGKTSEPNLIVTVWF